MSPRHCQKRGAFSWSRSMGPNGRMRVITLLEEEAAGDGEFGPRTLRQAWRELRDLVDEIDLEAMEETA